MLTCTLILPLSAKGHIGLTHDMGNRVEDEEVIPARIYHEKNVGGVRVRVHKV